jgi:hypothetical protein
MARTQDDATGRIRRHHEVERCGGDVRTEPPRDLFTRKAADAKRSNG